MLLASGAAVTDTVWTAAYPLMGAVNDYDPLLALSGDARATELPVSRRILTLYDYP